jgi:hypothetical protein
MALPVTFATLTGGNQPLSLIDTQFAAVAALGAIPCACSGQNSLALTPLTNAPTVASYVDLQPSFVFVASQTSTGNLSANISGLGSRPIYKWNGSAGCGAGDFIAGNIYRLTPLQALNGGSGGFLSDAIGVNNNVAMIDFLISGGGNPITTGAKGSVGPIPWACTVFFWTIDADQSGSIAIDILRASNAHPTASIVGGGTKPNLTSQQYNGLQSPVSWTSTALLANDMLEFSVFSAATVTNVTIGLSVAKI